MSEENCSFCGGNLAFFRYPSGILGSIDTSSIPDGEWTYCLGSEFNNSEESRPRYWEVPDTGISLVDFRGGCFRSVVAVTNDIRQSLISSMAIENMEYKRLYLEHSEEGFDLPLDNVARSKEVQNDKKEGEQVSYCGNT